MIRSPRSVSGLRKSWHSKLIFAIVTNIDVTAQVHAVHVIEIQLNFPDSVTAFVKKSTNAMRHDLKNDAKFFAKHATKLGKNTVQLCEDYNAVEKKCGSGVKVSADRMFFVA